MARIGGSYVMVRTMNAGASVFIADLVTKNISNDIFGYIAFNKIDKEIA